MLFRSSGNWLRPTRSVLVGALLLAVVANAGSAWLPPLPLLLSLRFISGLSLGTITWFAWANAFGVQQKTSQVAVVGPVIGVLSTPLVAVVIERWGMRELFVMLAVLPILPLSLSSTVPDGERRPKGERHRAATTARVVLLALTAFSLGGSAVYQLGVTIGHGSWDSHRAPWPWRTPRTRSSVSRLLAGEDGEEIGRAHV